MIIGEGWDDMDDMDDMDDGGERDVRCEENLGGRNKWEGRQRWFDLLRSYRQSVDL